jgi:hypothetical protein
MYSKPPAANVSIRQHTSAHASIRQHLGAANWHYRYSKTTSLATLRQ